MSEERTVSNDPAHDPRRRRLLALAVLSMGARELRQALGPAR